MQLKQEKSRFLPAGFRGKRCVLEMDKIIYGNAIDVLKTISSGSIDMCITSPPYWALRDYQTEQQIWDGDENCKHEWGAKIIHKLRTSAGEHVTVGSNLNEYQPRQIQQGNFCIECGAWYGSLGLEPSFELYIKHLCDIFDEVKRVLRKTGTCWVNLGDTYAGSGCGTNDYRTEKSKSIQGKGKNAQLYKKGGIAQKIKDIQSKCLCLIPFRLAIEMVNRGWILRNVIIWQKPNCMPSSAKDRFTVDFEYLFFFVKNKKYYFETQCEPMLGNEYDINRMKSGRKEYKGKWSGYGEEVAKFRSPRVRTQRKSWDSKRIQSAFVASGELGRNKRCVWIIPTFPFPEAHFAVYPEALIETPIKAGCPKEGVVLDPFIGSGTTAVVSKKLGRNFIGIELNPKYIDIAKKRLNKISTLKCSCGKIIPGNSKKHV